jgi:putative selenate reductase molybdopterin-binding subunit
MSGTIEMGNGSDTTLSQIAAETLGVRMEDIRIVNGDTAVTPYGWGVRGSRTTTIDGMAVYQACVQAREQLFETASDMLECHPEELVARDRKIFVKGAPEKGLDITEVYDRRYNKYGSQAVYTVTHYDAPSELPDPVTGFGNWSSAYAFGTKIAEVEVDEETGQVTVLKVIAVNDTGKVINPEGAAAQLEGGVLMGVGYALTEGLEVDEGQASNASFVDYKLPATIDAPKLEIALIETEDPNGPWGAKGLGEMAQLGTSAAIANAVYDAVGARVTTLPITPDKVLAGMKG